MILNKERNFGCLKGVYELVDFMHDIGDVGMIVVCLIYSPYFINHFTSTNGLVTFLHSTTMRNNKKTQF